MITRLALASAARRISPMPEGLWNGLADEQVRDLVAYLASPLQEP